jgi:hypothetical protein
VSRLGRSLRRRAARGPCGGARPRWRGRPGYASARGNRGPSPADGCSAGTYACSLELQVVRETVLNQGATCRAHCFKTQCVVLKTQCVQTACSRCSTLKTQALRTWLSLLTVWVIRAQVKLSLPRPETPRFPQRTYRRRLRLWKIRSTGRLREAVCRFGMGKPRRSLRAHLWTNLWTTSCGQ